MPASGPVSPTPIAPAAYAPSFDASMPIGAPGQPAAAGPNAAPLAAAASIPVNLPAASAQPAGPNFDQFDAPSASAGQAGPWLKYQVAQPSPAPAQSTGKPWEDFAPQPTSTAAPVTRDPWERPIATAAPVTTDPWERPTAAAAPAPAGPWTKYQTAQPSTGGGKPWEDFAPQPVATQQNGPRAWGQASNLDDPYANASLADSAAAIGRTADNAVRNVVDGMTLGYGNKIAAGLDGLTGRSPDYASALNAERGQSAQAMAQSPGGVGTAEQIAGMALPAGAIGRGAAALGEAASALPFGLARFAASPLAQASATGATVGGINAAGNDQPVAPNAVLGALAGAGGNAIARGAVAGGNAASRGVARLLAGPAAAPSTQALKDTAQAAYGQADKAGVVVSPTALDQLRTGLKTLLANNAYDPALQPKGAAIVNHIEGWPQPNAPLGAAASIPVNGASLRDLDLLRQKAAAMYDPLNDSSSRLGGLVKGHIDSFVNGLTPADVASGDPRAAAAALDNARSNWTKYSKANDLEEGVGNAQSKDARATFPGAALDKTTRDAIAKVRDSRSNWTPDELAALNEAANGTVTQRGLRMFGALAPNNSLLAMMHGGAALGGGVAGGGLGALAPLAGTAATLGARKAAAGMTNAAVGRFGNIVRSGGALPAPIAPMGPSVTSPLAALLMGSGVSAFQPAQPYPQGLGAAFAQ